MVILKKTILLKVNKSMKENKIIILILIISIILIIIDQTSKVIVKSKYNEPIGNDIISIELIQNEGIAFGLNNGNTKNIVLTIMILMLIVNFVIKQKDRITIPNAISISLIFAGGISNLIDRILRGGVIDFIKVNKFAIFNIADCYIVCGWIMLIIFFIKENKDIIEVKDCEKN